eukprot:TRINITY_DN9933_c0_g1_i3.p1 TRINITY_DN9933_c0_g1~~TRINITY_DN9933_c0_g1_i3.p1  ORF type:complete len:307 (+),score=66.86 TRINITY_DN9933_c0_g1_i3:348-1268(+)
MGSNSASPSTGSSAGDPLPCHSNMCGRVVLQSNSPDWVVGDFFGGSLPFTTVQVVSAKLLRNLPLRKLSSLITKEQLGLGVGVLGMPGSTAYGGLIHILAPRAGETVWVSGAAGAVGSMVGQIAKNVFGCTVIGSAGGPKKCAMVVNELGFDHCVDYKQCSSAKDLIKALRAVAPGGIDCYFENVGGMHFEAAMSCLRPQGRVAVCGAISVYNHGKPAPNQLHITNMIYSCQRIEGFVCTPWLTGQKGNFLGDMAKWTQNGQVKIRETTFNGVQSFGKAFNSLFVGGNVGKVVVCTDPTANVPAKL